MRRSSFALVVVVALVAVPSAREVQVLPSGLSNQTNLVAGTGLLLGQVVDANGSRPVAGALVTLSGAGVTRSVITEARGRFVFRDLPPATFGITASKPGFADGAYGRRRPNGSTQSITLAEGQRVGDLSIPIWRHGVISGTIRDEAGEPVVRVEVRALVRTFRTGDPRWVTALSTQTDDRGAYRLASLPPGEYTVVVPTTNASMGGTLAPTAFELIRAREAGESSTFTQGQAVMVGAPLSLDRSVMVDGELLTTGIAVAPGRQRGAPWIYRTTFYPNAVRSSQATSMTVRSGEEYAGIDFDLMPVRTVTVSGVVTSAGIPAANVRLELMRAAETLSGRLASVSDIRVATSTTDANGRFRLLGVPDGEFVLRAASPSGRPDVPAQWAKLPVVIGTTDLTNLVVPLHEGFVVSGRLEFEGSTRGAPETITSTSVNVEALDPRDAETKTGRVGADGRFVVSGVPAGRYLILHASSYALWSLKSVTIGGREMLGRALEIAGDLNNVVLTFTDRPTRLSGQVTDGSGIDAAAAVVVFPGAGFSLTDVTWNSGSPRFRLVRVGRNGQYLMAGLPPGPYYVAALPDEATDNWVDEAFLTGLSGSATPIQLNDGDQRTLDLRVVQVSR